MNTSKLSKLTKLCEFFIFHGRMYKKIFMTIVNNKLGKKTLLIHLKLVFTYNIILYLSEYFSLRNLSSQYDQENYNK